MEHPRLVSRFPTNYILSFLMLLLCSFPLVRPAYNWDTLGYLGNVYLLEGLSTTKAHARVYADAAAIGDAEARGRLINDEKSGAAIRARDAISFLQYLPFYSIRPAYIGFTYLLYRLGAPAIVSLMLVSAISYSCAALIVIVWLRRYFEPSKALLFSLLILFSLVDIAKEATPDMMSCALLLFASYQAVENRSFLASVILIAASVLVRTDNLILLLTLALFLWYRQEISFVVCASACLSGAFAVTLINHFGGTYSWALLFQQSFYGPFAYPAQVVPHVSSKMYIHTALVSAWTLARGYPYLPILFAIAIAKQGRMREFFCVVLIASLLHFLLFPNADLRYYVLAVVVGSVAATISLAGPNPTSVADSPCEAAEG